MPFSCSYVRKSGANWGGGGGGCADGKDLELVGRKLTAHPQLSWCVISER